MRKSLIIISLLLLTLTANALQPVKWNKRYQDYIDRYRDVAIYQMLEHDIPASITMAQGLLESSAGESDLSTKGNNHFGIKCHDWTGKTMTKDDDERNECFRVYSSAYESFDDHSKFLHRPRYAKLFKLRRTDYVGWARGLKECGYATNPKYAQLLIDIIRCYNLDALDHETNYNAANVRQPGAFGISKEEQDRLHHNSLASEHLVRMSNRNYYVEAREGDTFDSIAKEFGLSGRKVAKYNERDRKAKLAEGDIVYLEKKRKKADKLFKKTPHIVKGGESMYSIAQFYGVRLKSLYKKNKLSPDYELKIGDKIKVY